MEVIANTVDTDVGARAGGPVPDWGCVLRDVLMFQFKLVVDGLKDLCLAQLALGAALVDLLRRDGSPGRRFYGIVELSERFDGWLDLHEPLSRVPEDAPDYAPPAGRRVEDLVDRAETSARGVVRMSHGAFGSA